MGACKRIIALALSLSLLGGCGGADILLPRETGTLGDDEVQTGEVRETESLGVRPALFSGEDPAILWAREQLGPEIRTASDRISAAIAAHQQTPVTVQAGEEDIHRILAAVRIDHPEYYWFDGVTSFVTTAVPGLAPRTECSFTYTLDLSQTLEAHGQIRDYVAACLETLEAEGAESGYEKILGVYRYLIERTDYVMEEPDQSIVSVMTAGRGTCAGYARSFQYLMSALDIPCTLAVGDGPSGESHGWNMVMCGGEWYQVDVTWGDPVEADGSPGDSIQYTYCMITDGEMYRDHHLTGDIPMPVCSATEYNYFVKSGRQMETWDPKGYTRAMAQALEQGERWFSVRFTGEEAFLAASRALFEEEEVWDILQAAGIEEPPERVVYGRNEQFLEISVALAAEDSEETDHA